MQVRTSLYGLPETPLVDAALRVEARRYRRLTWVFSAPFLVPLLAMGLLATEFLLINVGIPLVLILLAGRWPSAEEIEARMAG